MWNYESGRLRAIMGAPCRNRLKQLRSLPVSLDESVNPFAALS
jgi:hypothetical protein